MGDVGLGGPGDFELGLEGFSIRVGVFFVFLLLLREGATHYVSVLEVPFSFSAGLVILECALVEGTIGEDPLGDLETAILPHSVELHSILSKGVGAGPVLVSKAPPS